MLESFGYESKALCVSMPVLKGLAVSQLDQHDKKLIVM